jgi:pimeloyl-ACP methyl ester carboxylesterase
MFEPLAIPTEPTPHGPGDLTQQPDLGVSAQAPLQPRFDSVRCISPAGLHRMAYTEWGDPHNPRVLICVHGLTRSGRDFDAMAHRLGHHYRVICPDVVGRGRSDWLIDPNFYVMPQYVADMVTLVARLGVDTVDWFGTSMGGLIGMALAGLPNSPIARMAVNDVGPRLDPVALERIGTYLGQVVRFGSEQEGIEQLAALAQDFGPHTPEEWRTLNQPLLREHEGHWVARYDPDLAKPFLSTTPEMVVAGEARLWQVFEAFKGPMLVVRGEHSDLLTRETVTEMQRRGHHVSAVEIPGVGHAPTFVHDDQLRILEAFLLGNSAAA